jgi:hypothetical protein
MSIEAMKQALEALEYPGPSWPEGREKAAQALRTAIEEAEKQEPVAWRFVTRSGIGAKWSDFDPQQDMGNRHIAEMTDNSIEYAYTTPPAQPTPVQEPVAIDWDTKTDTPVMGYTTTPAAPVQEPDFSNSETLLMEPWKNPLCPVAERLVMADGAVAFERKVNANLRERLAAQPAPVQEPEQVTKALMSAAGIALEVLEKHHQMKGDYPMGMLGVRAAEELREAFRLLYPTDDREPPAAPVQEKNT